MDEQIKRNQTIVAAFKCPSVLDDAIVRAARLQYTNKSEYLRRAALEALRKDGVAVEPEVPAS